MSSDCGPLIFPCQNTAYYGLSVKVSAAFAANVAAISLANLSRQPPGTYRMDVTIVATALATLAANCAFNVLATDAAGAYTSPVPLVANGAGVPAASFNLGTTARASGSLIFQSSGLATDIQYSITGITTPGPLAAVYSAILTRIG